MLDKTETPEMVTTAQLAEIGGCSVQAVLDDRRYGHAPPAIRSGRQLLWPLGAEVDAWARRRREGRSGRPDVHPDALLAQLRAVMAQLAATYPDEPAMSVLRRLAAEAEGADA